MVIVKFSRNFLEFKPDILRLGNLHENIYLNNNLKSAFLQMFSTYVW